MLRQAALLADYSQAQVWLHGPRAGTPPGQNADAGFGLPADTVWMNGHDGQAIALVPSRKLAVLRPEADAVGIAAPAAMCSRKWG